MSVPPCLCKVRYQLSDAHWPAVVEHCALHAQAAELFEIAEMLTCGSEQVVHHAACRCLHCRAIRAVFKARGKAAPMAKSAIAGAGNALGATKVKS